MKQHKVRFFLGLGAAIFPAMAVNGFMVADDAFKTAPGFVQFLIVTCTTLSFFASIICWTGGLADWTDETKTDE